MSNAFDGEQAAMGGGGTDPLARGPGPVPAQYVDNVSDAAEAATQDRSVLKMWTLNQLQRLRNFRRPYDQRRAYYYRQYIGQRDRLMFPDNLTARSNTFVPYPSSNVDAMTSRILDAFFSIDPQIECRPKANQDDAGIKMQMVLLSCFHKANWQKHIELFIEDMLIYGHAGIKIDWDWDYDVITGPEPTYLMQPVMDPSTGGPMMGPNGQPQMQQVINPQTGQPIQNGTKTVTKQVPRNCPKLINIDIYDLLIDPDGKIKAHVMEQAWGELRRSVENNPNLYFPEAIAELTSKLAQYQENDRDGIIIRFAEMWDDTKKNVTVITFGEDADAIGWKDRRYQYRNASYSAYKRRVYNGPPVLLYTGPNPFAHKRMPILDEGYISLKGDVYGIGLIEKISDLCEAVNVMSNMVTDNWNMGINRRYAYDVQVDIDHEQLSMGNVPGGKVGVVGDPSKALFPLPVFTPNQNDYLIIDMYKNMIEMSSGISDFYAKGVGSPTGNRTSTGISQAINESGYVFKRIIRNLEMEVLQPMCEMVASMIQQFGTDKMEYSITNAPPGIPKYGQIPLEELVGAYSFDFVGANYATGKVVKQRNLMAFYNLAMQSPFCNQGPFLQEIARAMEIPFANRLLKPIEQVQQEQQKSQQLQVQLSVMEKLLDFEKDALVKSLAKKEPNIVTEHALAIQQQVEAYLEQVAGQEHLGLPFEGVPPQNQMNEGRPPGPQFEGQIPGASQPDMYGEAQSMGANAMGMGGAGR